MSNLKSSFSNCIWKYLLLLLFVCGTIATIKAIPFILELTQYVYLIFIKTAMVRFLNLKRRQLHKI